jgi:hypothetical protein
MRVIVLLVPGFRHLVLLGMVTQLLSILALFISVSEGRHAHLISELLPLVQMPRLACSLLDVLWKVENLRGMDDVQEEMKAARISSVVRVIPWFLD